ncbi:hypothetical protein GCM10026982_19600 [Nocardiopsis aegyptia]
MAHDDFACLPFHDEPGDPVEVAPAAPHGLHRARERTTGVARGDPDPGVAWVDRQAHTMPQEDVSHDPGTVHGRAVPSKARHRGWEILNTVVLFISWIAGAAAQTAV